MFEHSVKFNVLYTSCVGISF